MFDVMAKATFRPSLRYCAAAGLVGLCLTGLLRLRSMPHEGGTSRGREDGSVAGPKAAPAVVVIEGVGNEADLRRQLRSKNRVAEQGGLHAESTVLSGPDRSRSGLSFRGCSAWHW